MEKATNEELAIARWRSFDFADHDFSNRPTWQRFRAAVARERREIPPSTNRNFFFLLTAIIDFQPRYKLYNSSTTISIYFNIINILFTKNFKNFSLSQSRYLIQKSLNVALNSIVRRKKRKSRRRDKRGSIRFPE